MSIEFTRRYLLTRAASMGLTGASAPWALNLGVISDAAAQQDFSDYKALVCVFLLGGNDHYNTVIPYDPDSYSVYARVRSTVNAGEEGEQTIAIPRSNLHATQLSPINQWPTGRSFALNPKLHSLHRLFTERKLAMLMNIGNLERPISKLDYQRGIGVPPKLFSHNDQTLTWSRGRLDSTSGYGGRLIDAIRRSDASSFFASVSTTGGSFLSSMQTTPYRVGGGGAVVLRHPLANSNLASAQLAVMTSSQNNILQQSLASMARRSVEMANALNPLFTSANVPTFPATPLGQQLSAIAKMISIRQGLGVRRQIFYAAIGGWDTHAGMPDNHDALLTQLNDALSSFFDATVALGVSDRVTTFTGSDFGRTLSSNGDGSDHGWGSFHMILGGSVDGGHWFGQTPVIALNGPDDVGSGRLLPAVSVDQYLATLALWFGISPSTIKDLVPRISEYDRSDLGFMTRLA